MNSNSRSMHATIAVLVATLMLAGIEPAAVAGTTDETSQKGEPVATSAPSGSLPAVTLPERPPLMTNSVAQATPAAQAPRKSSAPTGPAYTPPARQSSGKSKKWIWIIVAAAGAGVTAAILASGDDEPDGPTVQIGSPVVGEPQ